MKKTLRTKPENPTLATRKALVWEHPKAPPISDLFAGAEARQKFVRYWLHDTLPDLPKRLSYNLLRLFPTAVASEIGALFYGSIRGFFSAENRRIADNVARIRPDLEPAAAVRLYWRNRGRVMSEFSGLPRIAGSGDFTIEGENNLRAAHAEGPVVLLAMHLGNWELISAALSQLKVKSATFYMPPESRFEHDIACRVRDRFDMTLLPPGVKGVRPAMKLLAQRDGVVVIFGDEGFDGRIMAPFFGRPTHLSGNLAIAVRLCRHTDAQIVPVYVRRKGGSQFACHFLKPIKLSKTDNPGAHLAGDVERLNAVVEPIIRRHISQWYFLDHAL